MIENPLARAAPAAPFPLTLKDMFTNSYVVEVRPEMPVHEVKELVRTAKKAEAEGRLAAAREGLAQLEAEAARAQAKPELAALEARKAESAGEIARLEEQERSILASIAKKTRLVTQAVRRMLNQKLIRCWNSWADVAFENVHRFSAMEQVARALITLFPTLSSSLPPTNTGPSPA